MENFINPIYEFVQNLGYIESVVEFIDSFDTDNQLYISVVKLNINYHSILESEEPGIDSSKLEARNQAAKNLLELIQIKHKELIIDWEELRIEAQAGDCLIKLCAYLSLQLSSPEEKSIWLQNKENSVFLAQKFDELQKSNFAPLSIFGSKLGQKKKSTFIEAFIWKRYQDLILQPDAHEKLSKIFNFLSD